MEKDKSLCSAFKKYLRRNIQLMDEGGNHPEAFIIILSLIVIFIIAIVHFCLYYNFMEKWTDINSWGNFSMCVGAIIALASFIVLYFSFLNQSKASRAQQIDSTYFNLLKVQREIYNKCNNNNLFNTISKAIEFELNNGTNQQPYEVCVCQIYQKVLNKHSTKNGDIMHYFRHLYHLITFIEDTDIEDKAKRKYVSIIQAQMSNEELLIMCFNVINYCVCSDKKHSRKYLELLDYYHFFKNLRSSYPDLKYLIKPTFSSTEFKHL